MNVKIRETGKLETLSTIDRKSGVNWTGDLVGNSGAFADGQFEWSDEDDAYLVSQDDYDWWVKYISDLETTEAEAEALAERLGISVDDVMDRIGEYQDGDYDSHRHQAQRAMQNLEDNYTA